MSTLSVRELKSLAEKLDERSFAQQLGPFVLVERPFIREKKTGKIEFSPRTTRPLANLKSRSSVLDFDDLWVATLPPIRELDALLIGRTADCDVVLDEGTVSKHHAKIVWTRNQAVLEDLASRNGTLLNGTKVRANTPLLLSDNDAIDFGGVMVLFLEVATLRRRMGLRSA